MRPILLNGPRPADPAWFNRVRHGRHQAIVDATGQLQLDGERLRFADQGQVLPTGTPCVVWLESNFVCLPAAYLEAEAAAQREREAEREAERAAKQVRQLNQRRAEAQAFNAKIAVPVVWETAFKAVLSGLREKSWGDGRRATTVIHIMLCEELYAGRLHRNVSDFLCSAVDRGKRWVAPEACWQTDGQGERYQPQVTCRACLAVAARWKDAIC